MKQQLLTIVTGANHTTYTPAALRREARNAVKAACKRGKLIGYTIQINQDGGRVSLHASYETAPNQQTFTTVAL
jgi:hypothetical protein